MALSGFIVQLDRSIRPLSSLLKAKEVKAGNDDVDGLNKALFLPSLNTSRRDDADEVLRKTDLQSLKVQHLILHLIDGEKMLDHCWQDMVIYH